MTSGTHEIKADTPTHRRGPWVRRSLMLICILAALVWLALREPSQQIVRLSGGTMGTTYSVLCVLDPTQAADPNFQKALAEAIEEALEDINSRMSIFRSDSELSLLNAHVDSEPMVVSEPLMGVLEHAMAISRASDGAFDVTVGPIVNAYGFGPESKPVTLPTDEEIDRLRERVGYQLLELDPLARTVTKGHPEVFVDLGGIAKGYGADRVAQAVESKGVADYLVEVGGEVRVRGRRPSGALWRVGVENPSTETRSIHTVLELTDVAMATSGDYRNYYLHDGQHISHTIDPRSGRPVVHNLTSVTVLASDCQSADAWATALMVLGPVYGYNVAEREGVAALFLIQEGPDALLEKRTSAFDSRIAAMRIEEERSATAAGQHAESRE